MNSSAFIRLRTRTSGNGIISPKTWICCFHKSGELL